MSKLEGRNLGPFRILEQIGKGGMASVYKAYQPSVDRYTAVKVLPPHFMQDPTFIERFDREARTIAKLEHPHILPVYDYGKEADGTTYIAMRYVEAGTLSDLLETSVLFLEDAYTIFNQIGQALAYAHSQGVVHRDMKPSNVLIDMHNQAFLTDFGLAKIMEGDSTLTGSMILGTPTYMAPEQGEGRPADERSDIYALGVILYEMTTGRPPFQAETPMAVMLQHMTEPLPLPREINPDLPVPVERIILKALAKAPEDRFQTVLEFLAALKEATEMVQANQIAQPRQPAPPLPAPGGSDSEQLTEPLVDRANSRPGWLWPAVAGLVLLAVILVLTLLGGEDGPASDWGTDTSAEQVDFAAPSDRDQGVEKVEAVAETKSESRPAPDRVESGQPAAAGWSHFSSTANIRAIAVQGDTVWVGSSGGLVAWDRQSGAYKKYTSLDGLPYQNINSLLVDQDGVLWAATEGGGILAFDGASWRAYTVEDGLSSNWISTLFQTSDGTLIAAVAYDEPTFYRFVGQEWVADLPPPPLVESRPIAITEDATGLVVGLESEGILYFNFADQEWAHFTATDGLPADDILSLTFDAEGNLLVVAEAEGGFGVYDPPNFHPIPELAEVWAGVVHLGPDGTLWLGSQEGVLWRFRDDELMTFGAEDGLPEGQIQTLLQDEAGVLWIGVVGHGLFRFDGEAFTAFTLENEPTFHEARHIVEYDEQLYFIHIWGSEMIPVYSPAADVWENIDLAADVTSLAFGSDGSRWLGTGEGLWRISPQGARRRFTSADGLPGEVVTGLTVGYDGGLWVGTETGLVYHNPETGDEWRDFSSYLPSPWVSTLYTAPDGTIYIGLAETDEGPAGLVWGAENFLSGVWLAGEGVPDRLADQTDFIAGYPFSDWADEITAVAVDGAGYLWVGSTSSGVMRWRQGEDWQRFDESDGAMPGSVRTIIPMSAGNIWFGTAYEGLWGLNPREGWWQETPEDGLPGWSIFAGHLSQDGHLWLATDGGIARFVDR